MNRTPQKSQTKTIQVGDTWMVDIVQTDGVHLPVDKWVVTAITDKRILLTAPNGDVVRVQLP